ncbi:MAG TPA: molybdopterin-synthase adenylyltransferase MoeB [Gemmatimonadales bacterium]|jgi:adenylyltransferase/sulfurtransferase
MIRDMPAASMLSPDELLRYARHLTLAEVGVAGQEKLKAVRVLLIGAGGLGSPAALYLAAAGVGTLGIVDSDVVDTSNLQRQVLHDTLSIGEEKTASARRRLDALNPNVRVELFTERLSSANARAILRNFDIVIDGSDNFPTRYLVNDACVLEQRPLVYGSILRFEGQLSLFVTPGGPCYRCLFSEPPPAELVPSCADAGVLGVLPGIIGTLQALEAIKWIIGIGDSVRGRLLLFDALALSFREIAVHRDPECPACGDHPTVTELIDYEAFCNVGEMRMVDEAAEIGPQELSTRLASASPPFLLDVREDWEFSLARIEGSRLIPLGTLPGRLAELPRDREVVTLCHHGARSLHARALLVRAGFPRVQSLQGGIDAWALEVEPGLQRY